MNLIPRDTGRLGVMMGLLLQEVRNLPDDPHFEEIKRLGELIRIQPPDLPSAVAETRKSIAAAGAAKVLNLDMAAGPIAAILRCAEQLDHPDYPMVRPDKLDNVSMPTYLRFANELRLTPGAFGTEKKTGTEKPRGSKLNDLQAQAAESAGGPTAGRKRKTAAQG